MITLLKIAQRIVGVLIVVLWIAPLRAQLPNTIALDQLPPQIMREFRGAWVATVGNIDWPSKPGLPPPRQREELIEILDKAEALGLNAIILQVRTMCDAFYSSGYEPWSAYLTGKMGDAPIPFYDPLEFAVKAAHARGLELHAWFNPFRAGHLPRTAPAALKHVTKQHPGWVRSYGTQLWLDPGEAGVQDYVVHIIADVVRRYDIDGVHLDDYFYPYREKNSRGDLIEFPDYSTWHKYKAAGGKLPRDDWRRENVNKFVHRLYRAIKAEKKWVKFGISPFGIWQPGNPQPIRGLNPYEQLYADSREWLMRGWVDYFSPQLYWAIEPKEQSYPLLLDWWKEQNKRQRLIWPGDAAINVGTKWHADEILKQIEIARKSNAPGHIHWNMSTLMKNPDGLADKLRKEAYHQLAVVPALDWQGSKAPSKPVISVETENDAARFTWKSPDKITIWGLQFKRGGKWVTRLLPGGITCFRLKGQLPEVVALTAFDRYKVGSPAVMLFP